ncbi:uncharacterized protein K444DRAFT_663407 [Hyaloscypha bicolor E]|uniref:Uncharacterized protein n=1 Tax=Hyaloscypha bicolor E TaxID=1095630 RepID=A0A2J6TB89_9HELO|nr:uncharacterized protein K444DRAFT_663407 [Hyaloscypha bicolor E]PMD60242.1 hypothetical protein K444DRAFT_663407 [Hyaloscypha bicolor E]
MPRRERKQGWAGVSKLTPTPVRGRLNSAEWPVHVIGNVTFHWNHKPRSRTDEERTAASLAAYIANPNDRPGIPANFKNYQPVWGIVKRGPHTTDSSTSATPDEYLHTTVKFSNQEDRDNYRGYTVHIYNDINWKYDPSKCCSWGERTPDQHQDQRVYYKRTEYPKTKYTSLPANNSIQPGASGPYSSGSDNQGTTYSSAPYSYPSASTSQDMTCSSAPTSGSYLSVPGNQGATYSSAPYLYPSGSDNQGTTYSSAPTSSSYLSASGNQGATYSSAPYLYPSGSDNQGTTYSSAPTSSSYLSASGNQGATYYSAPYLYPSASTSQDMTCSLKIVVEEPRAGGYWFCTNSDVDGAHYR